MSTKAKDTQAAASLISSYESHLYTRRLGLCTLQLNLH